MIRFSSTLFHFFIDHFYVISHFYGIYLYIEREIDRYLLHGSQPCCGEGACITHEVISHAMQGHPKLTVIVKSSDKMWSTGGGNGKPLQYSCCKNPMNSMNRQKDMTSEGKPPSLEGAQYATGEERRAIAISYEFEPATVHGVTKSLTWLSNWTI